MKLTEKNKSDVDKGEDHKLQYLLVYVGHNIKYAYFLFNESLQYYVLKAT